MSSPVILIVTAEPGIAEQAAECVEGAGCRVRVQETMDDAATDLKGVPGVALVLLDGALSSGGALAGFREDAGPDLPILVLDSKNNPTAAPEADAVIPRPLHEPTLRAWAHMAERLWTLTRAGDSDIAERLKRSTEPLLRTAALSHAISGPLQNICAAVDMISLALPPDFEEEEQVEAIRRHVKRVAEIVRTASDEARQALKPAEPDDD